jgi:hypothetical protein
MVVWKFILDEAVSEVEMPQWSRLIHFGIDPASGTPAVWAIVNPRAEKEKRSLVVVGTGSDIPEKGVYVATMIDGLLVWHLFDTSEIALFENLLGVFKRA